MFFDKNGQKSFFHFSMITEAADVRQNSHDYHYANMPMQYTAIFHGCKNVYFKMIFFNIFLIFAQNIDCRYTLEPSQ